MSGTGSIIPTQINDAQGGVNSEGFTYLLTNLLADCAGLTEAQARMSLLNAAREFCQRTQAWVDVISFNLVPGAANYILPLDYINVRVLNVIAASVGGLPLSPASVLASGMVGSFSVVGTNTAPTGPPAVFSLTPPNIFNVVPTPTKADTAVVAVAVMPVAQAGTLPTYMTEMFFDALLAGAKSRLLAMPGRPYTSAPAAQLQQRIFKQQCQLARAEVLSKYTQGLQDWAFPYFAACKRVALGGTVPAASSNLQSATAMYSGKAVITTTPITPNGTTTVFTIYNASTGYPITPISSADLFVSVDGVVQIPGTNFTCTSAGVLTFTTAPEADAVVSILWVGGDLT